MALLSTIRDLHRRKGRERRGLALAEGVRLVEEMVAVGVPCKGAAIAPALSGTARGQQLRQSLVAQGITIETISDAELADHAATEHPQGVIAVYEVRVWPLAEFPVVPGRPIVVLDGVQDPGNVGTIARTAVAFGAAGLIALPGTADLTNPKTVRGAAGALFRLPHCHSDDRSALDFVVQHHIALWVTAMGGAPLETGGVEHPIALVFGNEGAGVRPELLAHAARTVTIPIHAGAESLNVSVAAGIALYAVTR